MPDLGIRRTTVLTPTLAVACEERGPPEGVPVVLLHGFPYDPRCFDEVAPRLAGEGYRVVAPYLRGRWRLLPWALVAVVMFARVYVGAHNPLDVIAGAALGCVIGGCINLVVGVPAVDDVGTPPA